MMRKIPMAIHVIVTLAVLVVMTSSAWANPETMTASYYGGPEDKSLKPYIINGKKVFLMANGKVFRWTDPSVAAHKTLPFGTRLRLTNPQNDAEHIVIVQDRGPYIKGRDLDLSKAAAMKLGYQGVVELEVEILPD